MICHRSQGFHGDFEMLIWMSAATSLCTFKNTADLSFMCAWKFWRLPPVSPIVKDVKDKYGTLSYPGCIKKSGRKIRKEVKNHNSATSHVEAVKQTARLPNASRAGIQIQTCSLWNTAVALCFGIYNFIYLENRTFRPRKLDLPRHNYTWFQMVWFVTGNKRGDMARQRDLTF